MWYEFSEDRRRLEGAGGEPRAEGRACFFSRGGRALWGAGVGIYHSGREAAGLSGVLQRGVRAPPIGERWRGGGEERGGGSRGGVLCGVRGNFGRQRAVGRDRIRASTANKGARSTRENMGVGTKDRGTESGKNLDHYSKYDKRKG